ncbi:hypothetical protein LCGC14_1506020 [marine sediment metagenome]|uniref:Uncharacterized protein n=1 Tax=marine sediment metagenome TaxID=412755 RepID=A0A0F9LI18_9ZZZZ
MRFKCEGCDYHCIVELAPVRPYHIKYCIIDGTEETWKPTKEVRKETKEIGKETSINEKLDSILQAILLGIDTGLERMESALAILLDRVKDK